MLFGLYDDGLFAESLTADQMKHILPNNSIFTKRGLNKLILEIVYQFFLLKKHALWNLYPFVEKIPHKD